MLRTFMLSSALVFGLAGFAHADDHHDSDAPGPGWISFDQAAQKLHSSGYGEIYKLEADDGYWKAKAVKDGVIYKVRLDPTSGNVADQYRDHDDHN